MYYLADFAFRFPKKEYWTLLDTDLPLRKRIADKNVMMTARKQSLGSQLKKAQKLNPLEVQRFNLDIDKKIAEKGVDDFDLRLLDKEMRNPAYDLASQTRKLPKTEQARVNDQVNKERYARAKAEAERKQKTKKIEDETANEIRRLKLDSPTLGIGLLGTIGGVQLIRGLAKRKQRKDIGKKRKPYSKR
jgi:hypothetical protein